MGGTQALLWLNLFLTFLVGVLLGVFFFGGLWWTVHRMTSSSRPYLLALASFLVRMAAVLGAFYLLLLAKWEFLITAGAGFMITRTIIVLKMKKAPG